MEARRYRCLSASRYRPVLCSCNRCSEETPPDSERIVSRHFERTNRSTLRLFLIKGHLVHFLPSHRDIAAGNTVHLSRLPSRFCVKTTSSIADINQ